MNEYFVYILANKSNSVLYIGVTNDIERRIWEHKSHTVKGFTQKYNVDKLVYFEQTDNIHIAIAREKQLKNWQRKWKDDLIVKHNPKWIDVSESFYDIYRDPGSSPG